MQKNQALTTPASQKSLHIGYCWLPTFCLFWSSQTANSEVSKAGGPPQVCEASALVLPLTAGETGLAQLGLSSIYHSFHHSCLLPWALMETQPSYTCSLGALWMLYKGHPSQTSPSVCWSLSCLPITLIGNSYSMLLWCSVTHGVLSLSSHTQTCPHMYTYMYTHMLMSVHTHTHICVLIYICTCPWAFTHICALIDMPMDALIHTHTHTPACALPVLPCAGLCYHWVGWH